MESARRSRRGGPGGDVVPCFVCRAAGVVPPGGSSGGVFGAVVVIPGVSGDLPATIVSGSLFVMRFQKPVGRYQNSVCCAAGGVLPGGCVEGVSRFVFVVTMLPPVSVNGFKLFRVWGCPFRSSGGGGLSAFGGVRAVTAASALALAEPGR